MKKPGILLTTSKTDRIQIEVLIHFIHTYEYLEQNVQLFENMSGSSFTPWFQMADGHHTLQIERNDTQSAFVVVFVGISHHFNRSWTQISYDEITSFIQTTRTKHITLFFWMVQQQNILRTPCQMIALSNLEDSVSSNGNHAKPRSTIFRSRTFSWETIFYWGHIGLKSI